MLRGVIEVQKYFRGHRARRLFHELNKGAKSIQSCNFFQAKLISILYYEHLYFASSHFIIICLSIDRHFLSNAVVCGENIRRKYAAESNRCSAFASQLLDEQLMAVIYLQSGKYTW